MRQSRQRYTAGNRLLLKPLKSYIVTYNTTIVLSHKKCYLPYRLLGPLHLYSAIIVHSLHNRHIKGSGWGTRKIGKNGGVGLIVHYSVTECKYNMVVRKGLCIRVLAGCSVLQGEGLDRLSQ